MRTTTKNVSKLLSILIVSLSALSAAGGAASAQQGIPMPMASPAASVKQTIGVTNIKIDYARPSVKGRVIWGDLVPYGQVWRAGANTATVVEFSADVKIEGKELKAGKYAFFTIPTKDKWTAIFNTNSKQWGAYSYNEKEDALRVEVKPTAVANRERLLYEIEPEGDDTGTLSLSWEKIKISMKVEVNTKEKMIANIKRAVEIASEDNAAIFYQAAQYYEQNNIDMEQANKWIDTALKADQSFWNYEVKGRVMHKLKKDEEAMKHMQKAIELSKAAKDMPSEYWEKLQKEIATWQKK